MSAQPSAVLTSSDCSLRRASTHASAQSSQSLKLSRDLRKFPFDKYRLPTDGRKWKPLARDRQALAAFLGTFGDGDGSRVSPGVRRMMEYFGWSRAKTFRLLADLKELALLEDERGANEKRLLTGEHGTRKRRMNLPAFRARSSSYPRPGGQSETPEQGSQIHEQESHLGRDTTVTLTDQIQNQNLRPLTRPNSAAPCGKPKNKKPITAQQRRFAIIRRLAEAASEILERNPSISYPDLAESLKEWAASRGIPYFDAWPGAATPIQQAIEIAIEKRKTA
jgi:hypothetical protein